MNNKILVSLLSKKINFLLKKKYVNLFIDNMHTKKIWWNPESFK